jgi:hypothetical protein
LNLTRAARADGLYDAATTRRNVISAAVVEEATRMTPAFRTRPMGVIVLEPSRRNSVVNSGEDRAGAPATE